METEAALPLSGKKIGIFGKGGSGKSTCVVLLANILKDRGYDVCVLDADSTNIGIPQALGIDSPPESLIDYFGGMVFRGGVVTCPVDDPTPLEGAVLSLKRLDGRYWAKPDQVLFCSLPVKSGGKAQERGVTVLSQRSREISRSISLK